LEQARYGKHSIYNSLLRAKLEGTLTPALKKWIIGTGTGAGRFRES
jgi:hypothetical protein